MEFSSEFCTLAVKQKLEARIAELEAVLRKLHADCVDECEWSIDLDDIERVMPDIKPWRVRQDERWREGEGSTKAELEKRRAVHRVLGTVTVTREQMEHARDNPGEAWRKAHGRVDTDKEWP